MRSAFQPPPTTGQKQRARPRAETGPAVLTAAWAARSAPAGPRYGRRPAIPLVEAAAEAGLQAREDGAPPGQAPAIRTNSVTTRTHRDRADRPTGRPDPVLQRLPVDPQTSGDRPDRRSRPRLVQRDGVRLEPRRVVLHDHGTSVLLGLKIQVSRVSRFRGQGPRGPPSLGRDQSGVVLPDRPGHARGRDQLPDTLRPSPT